MRLRLTGLGVFGVGLALSAWFAFGLPPLDGPAVRSGSDYLAVSGASLFLASVGAIVAFSGLVQVSNPEGGPDH